MDAIHKALLAVSSNPGLRGPQAVNLQRIQQACLSCQHPALRQQMLQMLEEMLQNMGSSFRLLAGATCA